jgi:hypothetical protein
MSSTVIPGVRYRDAKAAIRVLVDAFRFEARLVVEGTGGLIEHARATGATRRFVTPRATSGTLVPTTRGRARADLLQSLFCSTMWISGYASGPGGHGGRQVGLSQDGRHNAVCKFKKTRCDGHDLLQGCGRHD